ncbi:class F sortase [Streptomyces sp. NPDC058373]|uniref:class F sortase n=1 Tax=unclassified Streptomyces TaxID=2593676 RepID=UPI003661D902
MTLSATLLLTTGVVRGCTDIDADSRAAGTALTGAASDNRTQREGPAQAPPALPHSPPTRLAVPGITIEAPVVAMGLDQQGRLGTPPLSKPDEVSWYRHGPSPGEPGAALIAGHRDTRTGPAIFLNLNALERGDAVHVGRADGRTAVFAVDEVHTYTKEEFPDDKVYGRTSRPELRLLTCGGSFDPKTGYSANVVVFAHLTEVRRGGAPPGGA